MTGPGTFLLRDDAAGAEVLGHMMSAGAVSLLLLGLYAMLVQRDLVRIILGLALTGSGVNLLFVAVGYRAQSVAPILTGEMAPQAMVDPLPQALVLTSIVIDVGVLALALALAIRVFDAFGTLDTGEVRQQIANAAVAESGARERAATPLPIEAATPGERTRPKALERIP